MSEAILNFAQLNYGSNAYPIVGLPLPEVFDFENAEPFARRLFSMASCAAGGHRIQNCRVQITQDRTAANLVADGVHIFYQIPNAPRLTVEEAIERHNTMQVIHLGSVTTTTDGHSWMFPRWEYTDGTIVTLDYSN